MGSIQKEISQRNVLMYYKMIKNHNNYSREFKFIIIINLSHNFDFELKLIVSIKQFMRYTNEEYIDMILCIESIYNPEIYLCCSLLLRTISQSR